MLWAVKKHCNLLNMDITGTSFKVNPARWRAI